MEPRKTKPRKTVVGDARAVIAHCAGVNARLAARRVSRFLDAHLQGAGLGIAQFGLMAHIAAARDDSIGALAERTGLEQSTLSRNLRALERAGLVEIAAIERDLRRRAVWLTERGVRTLEAAIPTWRRAHAALAAVVQPGDVQRLAAACAALEVPRD